MTRVRDHAAAAAAARTCLGADEFSEDAARDLLQAAGAVARRTRLGRLARLASAAAARRAARRDLERNVPRRPARRLLQRELDLGADVRSPRAAWA